RSSQPPLPPPFAPCTDACNLPSDSGLILFGVVSIFRPSLPIDKSPPFWQNRMERETSSRVNPQESLRSSWGIHDQARSNRMASLTCPHCQKAFHAAAAAGPGRCPHCRRVVASSKTHASRWYYARAKKKHGPFTWQQLQALAQRGEFGADDMLLQEGAKQWVR